MTMITPEDILEVMDGAAVGVCGVTFLQGRPNATDTTLGAFVVCELPYSFVNKTLGERDDWWVDVTVGFEIYVADRKTRHNPKEMDLPRMKELRSSLLSLFPIIDSERRFKISYPRIVIPASSDGHGYHFTRVQGKMTTLV